MHFSRSVLYYIEHMNCTFSCTLLATHKKNSAKTRVPTAQGKRKIVKSNSRQGKHREFENFGKTQGKRREFENFRMSLKSNSHLHSRAAGRDL